jgi:lysylphosphatidylglycerol synthetase-like protein (DUF2156 family)
MVEDVPIAVTLLYGVLFVILSIVLAVGGLALVQYLVPWQVRQRHNDVAGFIYAVLGVVYAVLLGFVTIAVFWLAREFPEPERDRLQELAISYAQVVKDKEWPLMSHGQVSQQAWALTDDMRSTISEFEPETHSEQVLYDQGLTLVHNLVDERTLRLFDVRGGIPRVLWFVLVVGGVIVVGFTYLFGLENTRSHRLMIASLAAVISLVLFTIYALDYPFRGITRVQPDAFELVLDRFEQDRERS